MNDTDHKHKWFYLETKTAFEQAPDHHDLYVKQDYAYLICNGCESIVKEKVKVKEDLKEQL